MKVSVLDIRYDELKKTIKKLLKIANKLSSRKTCYICNQSFYTFTKLKGVLQDVCDYYNLLNIIGSDTRNFACIYCGSHDRERHLYMFFDKLELWDKIKGSNILHLAPELNLQEKIKTQFPAIYIKGDLYPTSENIEKIDATKLHFDDNYFDFVIANHILEHIPDYQKALSEFYRVLKPGGVGIFQTPYSNMLKHNFEDENINTNELRLFFYGQEDHVRIFAKDEFFRDITDAGFNLQIKKHDDFFDNQSSFKYGVNKKEDLIKVEKVTTRNEDNI